MDAFAFANLNTSRPLFLGNQIVKIFIVIVVAILSSIILLTIIYVVFCGEYKSPANANQSCTHVSPVNQPLKVPNESPSFAKAKAKTPSASGKSELKSHLSSKVDCKGSAIVPTMSIETESKPAI